LSKHEKVRALLARAHENLVAALSLLQQGHTEIAASRTYYAMFYAAQAALLHRDLEFSKHSAVIGRFGREFAKDGPLSRDMFRILDTGFALRSKGDYDLVPVEEEEAQALLADARDFVAAVQGMLEEQGYCFDDTG